MTYQQLLDDLESKDDVRVILDRDVEPIAEMGIAKKYDVPFIRTIDDLLSITVIQPIIVYNEGTAEEEAEYHIKRNFKHLSRQPYKEDYQAYLESELSDEILDFEITIDGFLDVVDVRVFDGTEIVKSRYGVWTDDKDKTTITQFKTVDAS